MAKAPKVDDQYLSYWMAFEELITERPPSDHSLNAIPYSAIYQFCEREELDPLETEALVYVISEVDKHQRQKFQEKVAKQNKEAQAKSKVRR